MTNSRVQRSSGSAERALDVLELLARQTRPVQARALARECRIPRSSLHRLLGGLRERAFVEYEPAVRGWSLGPEALRIGHAAPSIHDAVSVLDAFDRDRPYLEPAEVAARSGLARERVARTLDALRDEGLVARDGDRWTLAARLSGLAARIEPLERLRRAARPCLIALRDETGETANLVVEDGAHAVYVDQVESRHALRHAGWAGRSIPLAGTAAGGALTAPDSEPRVATDAVETGVTAVASKIPRLELVTAAVSLIAPTARLRGADLAQAKAAVQRTAQEIAAELAD